MSIFDTLFPQKCQAGRLARHPALVCAKPKTGTAVFTWGEQIGLCQEHNELFLSVEIELSQLPVRH
jgi:hypothetical protein